MAEIPLTSTANEEAPELIIDGVVGAGLEIYRVAGGSLSGTFDGVALEQVGPIEDVEIPAARMSGRRIRPARAVRRVRFRAIGGESEHELLLPTDALGTRSPTWNGQSIVENPTASGPVNELLRAIAELDLEFHFGALEEDTDDEFMVGAHAEVWRRLTQAAQALGVE